MDEVDRIETKQKINIVKNFIKRFDSANKQNIEKQLQTHGWIIKLIEDQLQKDKTFYTFGEKFRKSRLKKGLARFKCYPLKKKIMSTNFRRVIKRFTKRFC